MKCRHFFSFVLVLFLSFFFGFFIITDNTFAVTPSFDVYKSDSTIFCYNGNSSISPYNCSDYSYLSITSNSTLNGSVVARFYFGTSPVYSSVFLFTGSTFYFPIPSSVFYIQFDGFFQNSSLVGSSDFFTVTLIDSLGSGIVPSGDISITSNGTYDVSSYATATVDVPAEVIQGDYHDDLIKINNSILVCGAILLVLYFFYCIYRLIIKNSGVK